MSEPFFAPEVIEETLRHLGDHYQPQDDDEINWDAQKIVYALRAAGFRLIREPKQEVTGHPGCQHAQDPALLPCGCGRATGCLLPGRVHPDGSQGGKP